VSVILIDCYKHLVQPGRVRVHAVNSLKALQCCVYVVASVVLWQHLKWQAISLSGDMLHCVYDRCVCGEECLGQIDIQLLCKPVMFSCV